MGATVATRPAAATQPAQAQELSQSERMFLKLPPDRQSSFLEDQAKKDPAKCVKLYNLLTEAQQGKLSSRAVDAVMGAAVALESPAAAPSEERQSARRGGPRAAPSQHLKESNEPRLGQSSVEDGLVGSTRQGAPIYDPKALKRIHAAEMADLKEKLNIDASTEKKVEAEIRAEKDAYDKKNKVNLFNKKDHAGPRSEIERKIRSKYGLDQVDNLKAKQEAEVGVNEKRRKAAGILTPEEKAKEKTKDALESAADLGEKVERVTRFIPF